MTRKSPGCGGVCLTKDSPRTKDVLRRARKVHGLDKEQATRIEIRRAVVFSSNLPGWDQSRCNLHLHLVHCSNWYAGG